MPEYDKIRDRENRIFWYILFSEHYATVNDTHLFLRFKRASRRKNPLLSIINLTM